MKVHQLIKQLENYKHFDIEPIVVIRVPEENLKNRHYKYPYDYYRATINVGDIGHSDKKIILEMEVEDDVIY